MKPSQQNLAAATQQCSTLLEGELQFYEQLESLLTDVSTANLFSTDAATVLSTRVDELQRQRDEMTLERSRCQKTLAHALQRQASEVRMSELEPLMDETGRAAFRQRRLQVISRVEGVQRLLQRADVQFRSRLFFFSDLITALTGQTPSANCYGANGRRDTHIPAAVTHAIS